MVIQVYITSARRSYQIADMYRRRGTHVALGGLHVTSLPEEAAQHADTILLGPGEDTFPRFVEDFRKGEPGSRYVSQQRTLLGVPRIRRDLIKRHRYLVPNSIVVSRGCPHVCEFCYKAAFFKGGRQFYTQQVDDALAEIDRLPGRHLYFLDDHLFGNPRFAAALFDGMRGMGQLWQAAGTVKSVLESPQLLEKAVDCGLRSLFVGFETVNVDNLSEQAKYQNIGRDYNAAIRRLHEFGVMVNGSFVFGMDHDGPDVFERTVDWAVGQGLETATFHILTPYPDTALYTRMVAQGRVLHHDWDLFDTRHVVFRPAQLSAEELEAGYWRAYREFYRWGAIVRGAFTKDSARGRLRHLAYAGGWKKFEPRVGRGDQDGPGAAPVAGARSDPVGVRRATAAGALQPNARSRRHTRMELRNRIYRSRNERMLAGVAGGLADYFDIDPTLVRLTWAVGTLVTGPVALVLYVVCALIIPREPDTRFV